jgi:hypothetical protein
MQKPPSSEPHTFTAREFGAAIGASYQTVLRLIKRNKIKCLPLRHKLIPRSELDRFLREEAK